MRDDFLAAGVVVLAPPSPQPLPLQSLQEVYAVFSWCGAVDCCFFGVFMTNAMVVIFGVLAILAKSHVSRYRDTCVFGVFAV